LLVRVAKPADDLFDVPLGVGHLFDDRGQPHHDEDGGRHQRRHEALPAPGRRGIGPSLDVAAAPAAVLAVSDRDAGRRGAAPGPPAVGERPPGAPTHGGQQQREGERHVADMRLHQERRDHRGPRQRPALVAHDRPHEVEERAVREHRDIDVPRGRQERRP
jgi:hypothetical protein